MRTVIAVVTLLATAVVAHAEPESASRVPTMYVALGAMRGTDQLSDEGMTAEAGVRLVDGLYVHAQATEGTAANRRVGDVGDGQFWQARAGLELRPCIVDTALCTIVGLDGGVQSESFTSADHRPGERMSYGREARAYTRLGLDLGGTRVRLRQTFELGWGTGGLTGGAVLFSVAGWL